SFHAHTVELDRAFVRSIETAQEVEEGRLTGSRTTDHCDDLSGRELHVDAVQNCQSGPAATERPDQTAPASDQPHQRTIRRRAPFESLDSAYSLAGKRRRPPEGGPLSSYCRSACLEAERERRRFADRVLVVLEEHKNPE